jgi:hypothetical protein
MERLRLLRYVRIAMTATCLTACVLLVALWVRSYWWMDTFYYPLTAPKAFLIQSWDGEIWCGRATFVRASFNSDWAIKGTLINRSISSPDLRPFTSGEFRGYLGMGYVNYNVYQGVGGSHLGFVIASAIGTIMPWLRWSVRYSLRTLLIVTTLVAVGMGAVVFLAR